MILRYLLILFAAYQAPEILMSSVAASGEAMLPEAGVRDPLVMVVDDLQDVMPPSTFASDIFMFGCTIFEIITGKVPFHWFEDKYDALKVFRMLYPRLTPHAAAAANASLEFDMSNSSTRAGLLLLSKQCTLFKPSERPSAIEVFETIYELLSQWRRSMQGERRLRYGVTGAAVMTRMRDQSTHAHSRSRCSMYRYVALVLFHVSPHYLFACCCATINRVPILDGIKNCPMTVHWHAGVCKTEQHVSQVI